MGKDLWEETLHDLVTDVTQSCIDLFAMPGIYMWLVFKVIPTPEDSEEQLQKAKEKCTKVLNYIQSIAEKRGKKYIVGDEVRSKCSATCS